MAQRIQLNRIDSNFFKVTTNQLTGIFGSYAAALRFANSQLRHHRDVLIDAVELARPRGAVIRIVTHGGRDPC